MATSDLLRLHDGQMIVPGEEGLRIISAQGRFLLKGKAMKSIHAQVAPHLDGRYTEAQLLEAVPAKQQRILQEYLNGLRDGGVFSEEANALARPTAVSLTDATTGDPVLDPSTRAVRFDRDPGVDVWFVAAPDPQNVMVRLDTLFQRPRPLIVALLLPAPETMMGLTNSATSFLLHLAQSLVRTSIPVQFALYLVDHVQGTSHGLFAHNQADVASSLARQLRLVNPSSLPQLPLASMEATHDLLSLRALRVGLDSDYVAQAALDALLAKIAFQRPDGWPKGMEAAVSGAIGSNPEQVHVRALEHAAWVRTRATALAFTPCDLLQEEPRDDAARYLVDVLRTRRASVRARYAEGLGGLHIYIIDEDMPETIPLYSTDPGGVQRSTLALAALRTFLPETVPPNALAVDAPTAFSSSSVALRIDALKGVPALPAPALHETAVWGHTLYAMAVDAAV